MKKQVKGISLLLALAMGMTVMSGCGKRVNGVNQEKMVDKYAAYCELPAYEGVEYEETKTEVTDDDVQYQIQNLLSQYSTTEQITTGKVANGDNVNIDFVGSVDGVEFEGGNSQGAGYDVVLGSGSMIPGFEEAIIGHEVGTTFDIDVTFPEEYGNEELNGKDAVFAITINYINNKILPEYNDAFVASYTDAATVAEYEEQVKNDMIESNKESDKGYNQSAVMNALIDKTTYNEYPEKEMEKLIDETVSQVQQQADTYGYSLGDYVAAAYGFTDETAFREYVAKTVEDYMKEKIAICAVAKDAGIEVTKDEVKEYKQKMMDSYGYTKEEELNEQYKDEDILYYALAEKVIDFLLEKGTPVEATTEAIEELE